MAEVLEAVQEARPQRFRPYPEYKDSGVEWLGEIPAHWEARRMKFAARIEAGQSPPSEAVSEGMEGFPFLQGNAEFGPVSPMARLVCGGAPKRARAGDILLSVRAPVGAINVADRAYGIGRGLCAIRPGHGVERGFAYYLLSAVRARLDRVATGSTYDAVTASDVGDLPALLPPARDQRAIAAFLDRQTAKIDALVAKKERLIDLLREKRTALITRAVIRGLAPNAPLRSSGIDWIGEVPEHWAINKLKYAAQRIVDCPHETPTYTSEAEYFVIRTADLTSGRLHLTACLRVEEDEYLRRIRRERLELGDIVYGREGERWGFAALVPSHPLTCLGQRIMQFRAGRDINERFLMWHLNASAVYQQGAVDTLGATSPHVNVATIRNYWLAVPPRNEQNAIAAFLDGETAKIDALVAKVHEAIDCVKEFRTALISSAVTGKIDVREETG